MIRMGLFLTLTVAVLLTSFICTDGVPAENMELKRRTDDCPQHCVKCNDNCDCCYSKYCKNNRECKPLPHQ
nr:TPA_inf: conotoxin precursor U [Conus judaeus]